MSYPKIELHVHLEGTVRPETLLEIAQNWLLLARHVEMELHAESGGVYPRMRDATASSLQQSYGFSLRPRTDTKLLAAVGADWSPGVFVIRFASEPSGLAS